MSWGCQTRTDLSLLTNRLKCFYFIVDTLRSIHLHTPSTVEHSWSVRLGSDSQYDFRELSESLVLDCQQLPADLTTNDYLLILFDLLSTINTLLSSLGPLTLACWAISVDLDTTHNGARSAPRSSSADNNSYPSRVTSTISTHNPYLPLTADREFTRLSRKLGRSLDIWQSSFEASACSQAATDEHASEIMLPLLHFSKLLLEGGPCVYALPLLAGYESQPHASLPLGVSCPYPPHKMGITFSNFAMEHAMQILESIESQKRSSGTSKSHSSNQRRFSPMWYPFALFYGALIVWAQLEMDSSSRQSHLTLLPSKRLLQGFYEELKMAQEDWDCARRMSEVVKKLMT